MRTKMLQIPRITRVSQAVNFPQQAAGLGRKIAASAAVANNSISSSEESLRSLTRCSAAAAAQLMFLDNKSNTKLAGPAASLPSARRRHHTHGPPFLPGTNGRPKSLGKGEPCCELFIIPFAHLNFSIGKHLNLRRRRKKSNKTQPCCQRRRRQQKYISGLTPSHNL